MNKSSKILAVAVGTGLALVAGYFVVKRKKNQDLLKANGKTEDQENKLISPPPQGNKSKKLLLNQNTGTEGWPLQKGSKGENVKRLQALLNSKYNAGLVVDGNFGSNTYKALLKYMGKISLTEAEFNQYNMADAGANISSNSGDNKKSLAQFAKNLAINPFSIFVK